MEMAHSFDLRMRAYILCFFTLSILIIIWKLSSIETDVEKLQFLRETLYLNKEQLQLSHHQLLLVEHLYQNKIGNGLPTIYAITPTYTRYVQKAELTRLSQTLALVPNIHWIVIEDAEDKTELVAKLLNESHVFYTHLNKASPKLKKNLPKHKVHRGVEQRNAGLSWLRENLAPNVDKGVVYFMDDDNTYSVKLFKEISKVQRVGVWPVGLVGGFNVETPLIDSNSGRVTGFKTGWRSDRKFAVDMAGFGVNLDLILNKKNAYFSRNMEHGLLESEFLNYFTTLDALEPLAEQCTQVYVWHTRTENPKLNGIIGHFEV